MTTSSSKWIPFTLSWHDAPLDLSWIYASEKPAGRHGFLKAKGNQFVFEDGTVGRFWGTNFNSASNFPEHAHAEKVARRLAQFGVNIARFHQLDAEWSTPNIFGFTKGRYSPDTGTLDPDSMDRLDYFIHCLKREGIYIYMDLLTYRRFRTGDGVAAADCLDHAAKPYSIFDRRLIELQKKFNEDLWNHHNPYTNLAYKDEPAIVMTEITNENDLFQKKKPVVLEPYRSDLEKRYRAWAEREGVALEAEPVKFSLEDDRVFRFFGEVQRDYYREMLEHLRSIGVKIPIAGTNWPINAGHLSCEVVADFTDGHAYHSAWGIWNPSEKKFINTSLIASANNLIAPLAFNRVSDKPYFVSEWDNPWPNEWRAESSLLLAAVGSFQEWGGYCIHTYRYDNDERTEMIGKPITSDALGNVGYRGGVFDTFNDPAKFGLFYHAALITRRGDISPGKKVVAIQLEDMRATFDQAYVATGEQNRLVSVPPGKSFVGADRTVNSREAVVPEEVGEVKSDTGEMYRSWKKRYGWIHSPRTRAAYGFIGAQGEIRLGGLSIRSESDFATIAMSSLSDKILEESDNLLLTAVGRSDNTGARYNEDHTIQFDPGSGPILVEAIRADITLKTSKKNLRIWSVNPNGMLIGLIPREYRDDALHFTIGGEFASIYYLIQVA